MCGGICKEKCQTIQDLHNHIQKEHTDTKLEFLKKVFFCRSDFDQWKAEFECQTISSFTLHVTKNEEDLQIFYYRCNRSGIPVLKNDTERKKHTKN